ncbi:DoxX family membrane protein [Candidatus Peregrinibacteria bacterium]|nr:MAG: DoxX family membrane protein [Candidatus Peregrinibacteria bacterium]
MTKSSKFFLFLLRISLGWMYLYAGLTKLLDPTWTSHGYLEGAKGLSGFYNWLATPSVLPVVDFMNEWGLTLLGVSLILGIFVRLSGVLGALLMLLYYLALGFPYPNEHALIVDEHIIYIFALLYLAAIQAGRTWGLDEWCSRLPICKRFPKVRIILG